MRIVVVWPGKRRPRRRRRAAIRVVVVVVVVVVVGVVGGLRGLRGLRGIDMLLVLNTKTLRLVAMRECVAIRECVAMRECVAIRECGGIREWCGVIMLREVLIDGLVLVLVVDGIAGGSIELITWYNGLSWV
jgi:hypothetical protein